MSHVPARLRRLVIRRAGNRCEYCQLSQIGQEAAFHIDHIIPESQEGKTEEDNLALACVSCSLRKEARQLAVDPETNKRVPLFHPRRDVWTEHFECDGVKINGITTKGRATATLLKLNRPSILLIREEETLRGRFPP
jgi:HNH endonuclease